MVVIVLLALLATVLGLASSRALRVLRGLRADQPRDEPGVTLSVLPGRRAVVTVGAESEASPGAAHLVDEAVRDAFAFGGIDGVEVRRADGELLERRLRPASVSLHQARDGSTLDAGL